MSWAAILALAAGTYAMKAAGPLLVGGRRLPGALARAPFLVVVAAAMAVTAGVRALPVG